MLSLIPGLDTCIDAVEGGFCQKKERQRKNEGRQFGSDRERKVERLIDTQSEKEVSREECSKRQRRKQKEVERRRKKEEQRQTENQTCKSSQSSSRGKNRHIQFSPVSQSVKRRASFSLSLSPKIQDLSPPNASQTFMRCHSQSVSLSVSQSGIRNRQTRRGRAVRDIPCLR